MLDIAFHELTARAAEQVLAQNCRFRVDQRHCVLQLVAEAESPARLVVAAPRPQAARHRLVQKPAVGQNVERRVGRFHLYGAERALPVGSHGVQRAASGGRPPESVHDARGVGGIAAHTKPEHDLALLVDGEIEGDLDGGARIERRAHLARKA